jgi:hypothetical protein
MASPIAESRLKTIFLLFLSALCLGGAALYNGYPLVYSDTGTYIESGFTLETPFDRPIMYGLFIRLFSFGGATLWTVVLAQCLLFVIPFYLCIRSFTVTQRPAAATFLLILVLSLFTGLSWVASHLLPDLLTPVCLLCMILLAFAPGLRKGEIVFLYVALLFCTACHISHVAINLLFVISIAAVAFFRKRRGRILPVKLFHLTGIFLLSIAAIFTMGSSLSKSRHVFVMGHLLETGILDAYLDEHCGEKNYKLCEHRHLLPNDAGSFMWNTHGDSSLIKTGGWQGSKAEYDEIIHGTLTSPKYLLMHAKAAAGASLKQLVTIRVGEGDGAYPKGTVLYERIGKYVPYELREYAFSQQGMNFLAEMPMVNFVNALFTGLSLIVVAGWMLFYFRAPGTPQLLRIFIVSLLLGYAINCSVCATLSTLANRFGARESWFIPLAAMLIVWGIYRSRKISAGE